jgi:polyisoprenoid-binding protein YceI
MSIQDFRPTDTPSIETTRWRVDPERSRVEFRTPTLWGLTTVNGHFDRYDGTLDLQATPAVTLTIDAASLDTRNKLRDKHLRSADFFDVEHEGQVRFVSDSATLDGQRLKVRGRLEAAGKSIPLDLDAGVRRAGDALEIDAATDADHRELGMTHSTLGMIKSPSHLRVHARLVPDARRAAA